MPDEFHAHQLSGADFLAARGFAILADQAGAGKTATLIRAADLAGARKVAVFCPAVVRPHWAREFARWQTLPREIVQQDKTPSAIGNGVTIMSHASLVKPETHALLHRAGFEAIIVDEGGEFRVFDAARTRHLYGAAPFGLWSTARHVWHATATPVTNSAGDLFPLFFGPLAGHTALGQPDWFGFCSRFAEMRPDSINGVKPVGVRNAADLRTILRPHLLRREFELGVPLSIQTIKLAVEPNALTAAVAGLEGWTVERLTAAMASGEEPRDAAISRVRRALGLAMAPHAAQWLDYALTHGERPIVAFFHHQDVKNALYAALGTKWRVSWIDGGVTRAQLVAAEKWHQAGKLDLLLVQTQAGGMGITLTRGFTAAVVELPWTAAALWQAIKRVHRFTQTRHVWAALMTCDFWLMDVMLQVLATKKSMSEEILDPLTERVST